MSGCQVQSDSVWLILITVLCSLQDTLPNRQDNQPVSPCSNTLCVLILLHLCAESARQYPDYWISSALHTVCHATQFRRFCWWDDQLMNTERIIHAITLPWKRCSLFTVEIVTRFQIRRSSVRQATWQTWREMPRDRIGSGLCFSNERGLVSLMKMDSRFIVDVRSSSLSFCSSWSSPAWVKDYRTYWERYVQGEWTCCLYPLNDTALEEREVEYCGG